MYHKKGLVVVLIILGFSNTWSVEGLRHRRTTRPPLSENSTSAVLEEGESDKRYHHKPQSLPQNSPQNPPESLPQNPLQYPPPYLPQNPPQDPSQNSPQIIPEYPPHFPPQDLPQNLPQVTPPNPPTAQQYPSNPLPPYLSQIPVQVIAQKPLQNSPQYPIQNSPQIVQQYPPHSPPQHLPQKPPQPPENALLSAYPPQYTTILDQYDNRFPDGSYEFRYALSDDSVRYERGYFINYQQTKILVVKGYYSHRLPDLRYLTVFYTADQFGNRQNSYFSSYRPQLPRSLTAEADSIEDAIRSSGVGNTTSSDSGIV